jgi:hypothetical protein
MTYGDRMRHIDSLSMEPHMLLPEYTSPTLRASTLFGTYPVVAVRPSTYRGSL